MSRIPCLKVFKKLLMHMGQYPYQTTVNSQIRVALLIFTLTSLLLPGILQFLSAMKEQDIDTMMECVPISATVLGTMIKMISHNSNRKKFENIFNLMAEVWETAEINGEVHVLNEITEQGSKMGSLYRKSIWGFVSVYLGVPLLYPIMDFVAPLNETRQKPILFKLNYMVDPDDYFYTIYVHIVWCSIIIILIVTTIDSLYIVIIHYTCGLFAICGHQVKKAVEIEGRNMHSSDRNPDLLKSCVIMHYKAIRFHEYMEESTRMSYLFEICLNMIGITVTAVQTVMYFDKPEDAFRTVLFLLGQQFHLYIISVPGQMLIDKSLQLVNDIYCSSWYHIPVQSEKTLHIMQIRSCRPCKLTAGGLYEMNMENFGSIVKTSLSYFTVLLSFRD